MAYTRVLDMVKKGEPLPLDFAAFEGLGVQAYEVAKTKHGHEVATDHDVANQSSQQVPTPALTVDEGPMDIDSVDQVADDDNVENLDIVEVYDDEEEEPLFRTRHYQVERTKNKAKLSSKTIEQAQTAQALVSPIVEVPMETDQGGQITEDEEEDEPLTRARSKRRQDEVKEDKAPILAQTRGGLVDKSSVSSDGRPNKGKGKAPRITEDEEEDEPLTRARSKRRRDEVKEDKAPILAQTRGGLVDKSSVSSDGRPNKGKGKAPRITEDEEEDEPLTRARSKRRQDEVRQDKAPILAQPRGGGLVDKSSVSSEGRLENGKGKAPVMERSSKSPIGVQPIKMGDDELQVSQSSSPAGHSTSQFQRQTTAGHGELPVSVLSALQALDLTSVPLLHRMKLAIINELCQQDAMTAKKMLQLDKRLTNIVDGLDRKVAIKEVHWKEDIVLQAMEKRVEENKRRIEVCLAQLKYFRERLLALENAEKDRQGILRQILELEPRIN